MHRHLFLVVTAVALCGCGEKAQETKNAASAMSALAQSVGKIGETSTEAEKFYKDRQAKGDTLSMSYGDLQKMLPSAPSGYTSKEAPGGSSSSMTGFSMSTAEQTFEQPARADGQTPTIKVSLVDFGGTQAAYGMMALPMMMNISSEDAHQRMGTLKMSPAYTWASSEFNKDDKSAKVTAITRYRYVVTVEASNQTADQSSMVKSLAEDVVKKFAGK